MDADRLLFRDVLMEMAEVDRAADCCRAAVDADAAEDEEDASEDADVDASGPCSWYMSLAAARNVGFGCPFAVERVWKAIRTRTSSSGYVKHTEVMPGAEREGA